jgi:hypothetical protein
VGLVAGIGKVVGLVAGLDKVVGLVAGIDKVVGLVAGIGKVVGLVAAIDKVVGLVAGIGKVVGLVAGIGKVVGLVAGIGKVVGLVAGIGKVVGLVAGIGKVVGLVAGIGKVVELVAGIAKSWLHNDNRLHVQVRNTRDVVEVAYFSGDDLQHQHLLFLRYRIQDRCLERYRVLLNQFGLRHLRVVPELYYLQNRLAGLLHLPVVLQPHCPQPRLIGVVEFLVLSRLVVLHHSNFSVPLVTHVTRKEIHLRHRMSQQRSRQRMCLEQVFCVVVVLVWLIRL